MPSTTKMTFIALTAATQFPHGPGGRGRVPHWQLKQCRVNTAHQAYVATDRISLPLFPATNPIGERQQDSLGIAELPIDSDSRKSTDNIG